MQQSARKIIGLVLLLLLFVGGPLVLARMMLTSAAKDPFAAEQSDMLRLQRPPKGRVRMTPRLAGILEKQMQAAEAVPRIFMERLPETLPDMKSARKRKQLFTSALLPVILKSNEMIIEDRGLLLQLRRKLEQGQKLKTTERDWLIAKARKYRMKKRKGFLTKDIDILLYKIDIIPPSLALAQAAMESGWGTSYFAQQVNALFGEWTWGDAEGILPREREEGKNHKIRKFDTLLDSVSSYMTNLNRHPSYESLRQRRAELRELNLVLTGQALAPALVDYSERGVDYVNDILTIIDYNDLDGLDSASLIENEVMQSR